MAQKTFFDNFSKTLASIEQLETMDRDLSFCPAAPHEAKTLSAEQVEAFNRDGCVMPVGVFDKGEADALRGYFDRMLDKTLADGFDSYSLVDPHLTSGRMYDLMFEPRIVDCVKDLLGPNLVCWSTHFLCKLPREPKRVSWHQDGYYWPMEKSRTASVWLAIDDADRRNACMQFVTGSHLHGRLKHRATTTEEKNVLRLTVDGVEQYGRVVDDELAAGEMSLHSDLLLHGSGPNESDRRRCGLTMRYIDATVKNLMDWEKTGVLICGADPNNHWANPPRPDGD